MSDDKNESIHPRVRHAEPRVGHTNKKKNKDVTKRKCANIEAHLERHPRDTRSQSHLSKLTAAL